MSEPTSKLNDLSSETVTKLVSIIVAIVVFAVVLVPIVNGLADGNGDGSGSGESEKIVLNTFEDEFGIDISPYHSIEYYSSSETSTLPSPISYSLEDLTEIKNVLSNVDWSSYPEYYEFNIFKFSLFEGGEVYEKGLSAYYRPSADNIIIGVLSQGEEIPFDRITAITVTVSENYSLSYLINTSTGDYQEQLTIQSVSNISKSEYGFMPVFGAFSEKFTVNSKIRCNTYFEEDIDDDNYISHYFEKEMNITQDMIADNILSFTVPFSEEVVAKFSIPIQSTDTDGVWQFVNSLSEAQGQLYKNEQVLEGDSASVIAISTYGYTESESGSGSSSDSAGISGTAGTILKIIPVLVGVGVILAIVALFYDPRNLIKKD